MSTPLQHITVLLDEAVEALAVRADGVYVDCTFGRGGHSRLILSRLGPEGRLIAFDKDPLAIAEAGRIDDPRLTIVHAGFETLADELDRLGIEHVDGVLMDLGVSSPQIDDAQRGFSFRFDAPLDMRMDTTRGQTAADWLNSASEDDIRRVIREYGEERFAASIARAIVQNRADGTTLHTTRELAALCARCVRTREAGQDPATRTFQAIRIFINRELDELEAVLPQAAARLLPSGRLVVIAFHSLEDRIVKQFMRAASSPPELPRGMPIRAADLPQPPLALLGKPVREGSERLAANPRARSAIMRVASRNNVPWGPST